MLLLLLLLLPLLLLEYENIIGFIVDYLACVLNRFLLNSVELPTCSSRAAGVLHIQAVIELLFLYDNSYVS
jgi:hypothetical protein